MKDHIKQIIESLVKNPARGVKAGTNMKITYRAGENLDRAMKYFDDFGSQRKKIQKLMHSAEMDSEGNLVITPRSTQGAKKIRSMMQDVLAPRKKETNENYDAGQPKPVRIRGLTGQRITQVMKNMTPAQKARLLKKLGPKVRKLTKGGAFIADRIMQQPEPTNEGFKRGGHMSQIIKQKLRDKRNKKITAKKIEGQKRRQVMKNMTPAQKARLLKKLGPKVRKLTKGGAFIADRIMQQPEPTNEGFKRGGHMSQIIKQKLRDKRNKKITAKKIEGQKRRQKIKSQGQQER